MKRIEGKRFNDLFCAGDSLWLDVGDNFTDEDGDPLPEYALHIVGRCRIEKNGEVLLELADLYKEYGMNGSKSNADPRFAPIRKSLVGTRVAEVIHTEKNDLTVRMTDGTAVVFEAYEGAFWGLYPHHDYSPLISFGTEDVQIWR